MRRALFLILLMPLAAGCGAAEKVSSVSVADAATKTVQAKSSRIAMSVSFTGARNFRFGGGGVFDYQHNRGRVTIDMTPLARISGESVRNPIVEARFDGLVYYMKLPKGIEGAEGLPLGKWLKIDLAKLNEASGLNFGALAEADQNPVQRLRFLKAAGGDLSEVGNERIRGVLTTRYRTKLDLQKAMEASADIAGGSEQLRQQLEAEARQLQKETGLSEIPVEVWLDSEGLLRRMTMEFRFTSGDDDTRMVQTTEFYDFGVPVRVKRPPASETVDLTESIISSQ